MYESPFRSIFERPYIWRTYNQNSVYKRSYSSPSSWLRSEIDELFIKILNYGVLKGRSSQFRVEPLSKNVSTPENFEMICDKITRTKYQYTLLSGRNWSWN